MEAGEGEIGGSYMKGGKGMYLGHPRLLVLNFAECFPTGM
jgi:hypothetical protein